MHLPAIPDLGYAGLFVWIFAEQAGVPIPGVPVLLAAGALISSGRFTLLPCIGLVLLACLFADLLWYYIGRSKGVHILHFVCRLSWKPNTCISTTKGMFMRHGANTLLFAKFVPGLNTLAPPLAGVVGITLRRFLAYDAAGALIWGLVPILVGLGVREAIPAPSAFFGWIHDHGWEVGGSVVAFFMIWIFIRRRIYLYQLEKELRKGVTSEELKAMLDGGEDVVLLDVRHPINFKLHPILLPNARHIGYDQVEKNLDAIPLDRTLIAYCDCPRDQASVHVVRILHRRGAKSARVLKGGLEDWEKRGFATVPFAA